MDTKLDHGLTLFNPTDMSKVLYSESYDDYMHKSNPVQPMCHCWTPEQSIYVGCAGGQLLMFESDSGVTKVIANSQLTVCSCSAFAILGYCILQYSNIIAVYIRIEHSDIISSYAYYRTLKNFIRLMDQLCKLSHLQLNTRSLVSGAHQSNDELKCQKKDDVKTVSINENESMPKTGHAVLGQGSIDCIALSRKGLITAGKVLYHTNSSLVISKRYC